MRKSGRFFVIFVLTASAAAFLFYFYWRVYLEVRDDASTGSSTQPLIQFFDSLDEYRMEPYKRLGKRLNDWSKIFQELNKSGQFNLDDFEKVDFSLSVDPTYGDNPSFEFFNPAGRFKAQPVPQELLDEIAEDGKGKIIFNLRRGIEERNEDYLPSRLEVDILFAIVPNVKRRECNNVNDIGNGDPVVGIPFQLGPNNSLAISDGFHFKGCTYTHDRKHVYIFYPLFERYRRLGDGEWKRLSNFQ